MKIEALAKALNCELVLTYFPEMEDPARTFTFIPNPKPWRCRKRDHSNDQGEGVTPDDACAGLMASMIQSARDRLLRESESRQSASKYMEHLVNLNRELGR